jgi:tetratricopeptide (TPR) repeat protein
MKRWAAVTSCVVVALVLAVGVSPLAAQGREYYITGKVVDANNKPIAGAAVELRETTSRRGFRITSEADGTFKLVGLSHGIYDVTVTKEGYQTRTAEWDLHEAQETLKKVQFDPFVMLSETQVRQIQRDTTLKAELAEATALMQKGDYDAALPVLKKMLDEQPNDVNALYLTAVCHFQKKDLEEATVGLEKVTQLAPDFAPARVQLAACYDQRGDKERALVAYDAALKLDPDNLVALYNAGVLHYNAGHADKALPYFSRATQVKPDDDSALEMAGYCELQALHYAEALQYLERARALTKDPSRAATLDDILKDLRPRVHQTPTQGSGG